MDIVVEDLASELARRAASAAAEAELAVERAELTIAAGRIVRSDYGMVTRCAWCDRLLLAGRWLPADDAPLFSRWDYSDRITHGICRDCVDGLEHKGESRRRVQAASADG